MSSLQTKHQEICAERQELHLILKAWIKNTAKLNFTPTNPDLKQRLENIFLG